jgi:fucose 4-O-acetylase-like acetyltransferase
VNPWSRARELASQTPPHRERYLDFLRAAAILVVVFGHWLSTAPWVTDTGLAVEKMLGVLAWSHLLTWALQVMPVFFMVGGYANHASWEAAVRDGRSYPAWVQSRLRRLVLPVVPLLLAWAALALAARLAGLDPELVRQASRLALIPTWFLAVYVVVILIAPAAASAWRRFGLASFWLPVSAAVLVDALAFGRGLEPLRWANYVFVWLAVHQLGMFWRSLGAGERMTWLAWLFGGFAALVFLVEVARYPVAMLTVPGEAFSNSSPPTVALVALAAMQFGLLGLLREPARRWLERPAAWTATVLVNGFVMTIFLWHSTVHTLLVGLSLRFGGLGLRAEPGSAGWWLLRPAWLLAMLLVLVPVAALFGRFEQGGREPPRGAAAPAAWTQVGGALLVSLGLALLAGYGMAGARFPGLRVVPLAMVLGGVALIVSRRSPRSGG